MIVRGMAIPRISPKLVDWLAYSSFTTVFGITAVTFVLKIVNPLSNFLPSREVASFVDKALL